MAVQEVVDFFPETGEDLSLQESRRTSVSVKTDLEGR